MGPVCVDFTDQGLGSRRLDEVNTALASNTASHLLLKQNHLGPAGCSKLAQVICKSHGEAIKVLDLGDNSIGAQGAEHLGSILKVASDIEELDVSANNLGSRGAVALAHALSSHVSLRVLNLSGNQLGDVGIIGLAEGFASNTSLRDLNVSSNAVGSQGATKLCEALQKQGQVLRLDLSSNRLGDDGVRAVWRLLKSGVALRDLDLSRNSITCCGAEKLAPALRKGVAKLETLDISHNNIGCRGASALFKSLEHGAVLKKLKMQCNRIGISTNYGGNSNEAGGGFEGLVQHIDACAILTHLDLQGNSLGVEATSKLAERLFDDSRTLQYIDLSVNEIGDDGASAFGRALCTQSRERGSVARLHELSLRHNNICFAGASAMAQAALAGVFAGGKLDLSENPFGSFGASSIAKALSEAGERAPTSLCLRGCNLGPMGAAHIAKALPLAVGLMNLDLTDNALGEEGAEHMAEALQAGTRLKELNLVSNRMQDTGVEVLVSTLKASQTIPLKLLNLRLNHLTTNAWSAEELQKAIPSVEILLHDAPVCDEFKKANQ